MSGASIFVLVLLVLAITVVVAGVKTVPQGYQYTVERFRRYTGTLSPGLNLIVPFIDTIGNRVNVMEQVLNVPTQEVITKDNATVSVDGITFFQVFDAAKASYEVAQLDTAILALTMTNIRTVMGSMDLDQLLSHRDAINERLLHVVDAAAASWGVKVTRIEIRDIVPPADLVNAMGRQMKAEREKRASILEAEGMRQSEILRAEGQKQAHILEAEGRLEAARRDAEARERLAEAEANATSVLSSAVASGEMAALNYYIAEKYVQAFESLAKAPNQKVIMMPYEASALVSSLAGIGEIAREAFGGGSGGGSGGSGPAGGGNRRPASPTGPSAGQNAGAARTTSTPTAGQSVEMRFGGGAGG
ncbi:SPFH domain-containing protein [Azorhizobium oxalatiphilum]|uniref:SPFH domain-containing protein n=1 Tax=Azorhizobium oxalatiphilum TaxID=980631 RepID=UPI00166D74EB|nr:SPFH domain-containing protein [Azorhizobium oxalatiphilum]